MGGVFLATQANINDVCRICRQVVKLNERIRYYGGPFIVHEDCLQAELDR